MSHILSDELLGRKKRKIITEKKRRRKINHHLSELKTLLLETMNTRMSVDTLKLEHTELLQMTIDIFKSMNKGLSPFGTTSSVISSRNEDNSPYHAGYATCANEVSKFLSLSNVTPDTKDNIESFLSSKLKARNNFFIARHESVRNKPYDRTNIPMTDVRGSSAFRRYIPVSTINTNCDNSHVAGKSQEDCSNSTIDISSVRDPPFYDMLSSMFQVKSNNETRDSLKFVT